jgi:hypothetical protein
MEERFWDEGGIRLRVEKRAGDPDTEPGGIMEARFWAGVGIMLRGDSAGEPDTEMEARLWDELGRELGSRLRVGDGAGDFDTDIGGVDPRLEFEFLVCRIDNRLIRSVTPTERR